MSKKFFQDTEAEVLGWPGNSPYLDSIGNKCLRATERKTTLEGNPEQEKRCSTQRAGVRHHAMAAWRHLSLVLTTRGLRLRALLLYYIWGVTIAPYYSLSHFSSIINTNVYMYSFLSGLVEVPAYLGMWPAITYLGRRVTLAVLLLFTGLSVFVVTIFMILQYEGW
ncbi:Carcinine transporter [Portunus trituberculatus]|uniref:Carcinine transporter n=1 Tax=Portunus trituberculatus TaxID=210409 RepID=A0A5B7DKE7_PORTR|nr:Carcinine transporter [Portunus trituberculatus]